MMLYMETLILAALVVLYILAMPVTSLLKMQLCINLYNIFPHIFLDTDLHAVIKKGNILKDIHKQYIMYQLLKSTMFLHSGNVIHRDHKVRLI